MARTYDENQLAVRILLTATTTSPKPGETGAQRVARAGLRMGGSKALQNAPEGLSERGRKAAAARWRP